MSYGDYPHVFFGGANVPVNVDEKSIWFIVTAEGPISVVFADFAYIVFTRPHKRQGGTVDRRYPFIHLAVIPRTDFKTQPFDINSIYSYHSFLFPRMVPGGYSFTG